MDLKAFAAPNILNAAKIAQDTVAPADADAADATRDAASHRRRERLKFHLNLVMCLALTASVSVGLSIVMAYARGGQRMNIWFYNDAPQRFFDLATRAASGPAEPNRVTASWYVVGAAWTAVSLLLRRWLFWFPHPIGYIMLINPLMRSMWFSFFLGWLCKKLVTRYGGKASFERLAVLFLGLILGELLAILAGAAAALALGYPVTVDLNRLG
jgi:hypothetical protein